MIRRFTLIFLGLGLFLARLVDVEAVHQWPCMEEVATGEGTLELNNGDQLRIKAVAVFLRENGDAEVCLMTAKENFLAGGRWSGGTDASLAIDLEITNDTEGGRATGTGTVFLQEGCVPIARITMGVIKPNGTKFSANFIEKKTRPCKNPSIEPADKEALSVRNLTQNPFFLSRFR